MIYAVSKFTRIPPYRTGGRPKGGRMNDTEAALGISPGECIDVLDGRRARHIARTLMFNHGWNVTVRGSIIYRIA